MTAADWIAADWGTSKLRLWAMAGDGSVLAARSAASGMGGLSPEAFEPALLALADDLLAPGRATEVVICGMAGARQGWIEAPYAPLPWRPAAAGATTAPSTDPRLSVRILPGLCQDDPPDVLRGEETQIAGFLAETPDFEGLICLPGTHTKWVRVAAGAVTAFRTAMTGEAFALFAERSVLRHAMDEGWDESHFRAAVAQAANRPERVATDLFTIRARALLDPAPPGAARARLSGLFLGLELAATRGMWVGQSVTVLGSADLTARYVSALDTQGAAARPVDGTRLTLTGLCAARDGLRAAG
ncbi:2-dehydro-3-deoxygalactonokinase [Rhodovulum iodosum]|uniref:2-dehydro-3-deoxygalactonokinase n=1 Tax=Rhodovulum iodosum TaxID=68291 RepID=A0ABV3XTP7_9RHOB|nr:2-dehydro-3-deoxygalactonokinase [Rhodovulum robiginosum]RSK32154.1 2-dehydro-3-deoxygalactonokinase [Rhodovulum robiginosum]